ncbi:MAG TPA: hypothetical protein VIF82_06070 [Burkholderiaceae bacterium]|jgi:hypothetical protein
MTFKKPRNNEQVTHQLPEGTVTPTDKLDESRRRFTKSGLAVSGVLVTLASRPVLGSDVCKSPSGFLSGNLSTHGAAPVCAGRSPGYWRNNLSWPININTKFSNVFSCTIHSPYASIKMLDLLTPQNFDTYNLGMHLVAAYLNAVSGWTPFLTVETIKSMFTEWQAQGYFSPTANVHWSATQIVDYLTQTQS